MKTILPLVLFLTALSIPALTVMNFQESKKIKLNYNSPHDLNTKI